MADEKKQLVRITSPKGIAKWPFLTTPDSRFTKPGDAPDYKVSLVVSPEEAKTLLVTLTPMVDAAFEDAKSKVKPAKKKDLAKYAPWDDEYDKDGNPTGKLEIKFKSKAFYTKQDGTKVDLKPALFDGVGQKITRAINIGNGSLIRVNFAAAPFFNAAANNAGITLMMNAVQIIKLVEYGSGGNADSYGFGQEDDGFKAGDDLSADGQREPSAADATPASKGEGDF
jgi:hypothetical protein